MIKFCSICGGKTESKIPEGDAKERDVCTECHHIHYENPKIVCGCLPIYEGKILLCKRAIEPRYGFWTLPAGFMENGETILEGALRECWEEAMAEVSNPELYAIFNIPSISQVQIFFRGELKDGAHDVGEESLETQLWDEEDIPWKELSFPTVSKTLKHFFEDRKTGHYPIRTIDLYPP